MAYTKPPQAPFAANLGNNEFVVRLDTGKFVAVSARISLESNTGNAVVVARARAVNVDGSPMLDPNGDVIESSFSHTTNKTELASVGGPNAMRKLILLAVLGEDTAPLWKDPIHSTVMDHASIRTNLTSVESAGPVTNMAGLL